MDSSRVPETFEVQPLSPYGVENAKDPVQCGTCLLWWDDAISTSYTPAPGARCPFESFHEDDDRPRPLNGCRLIAALPVIGMEHTMRNWIVCVDRGKSVRDRYVTAWVASLSDATWDHGNYHGKLSDAMYDLYGRVQTFSVYGPVDWVNIYGRVEIPDARV